jgi:transcription elongation factor Elf1
MQRQQKITLGEMRQSGPRRLQIFCGNCKCAHSVVINAHHWSDDVRLSDLEPKFTCQICGHRGADIRPLFERAKMGTEAG